MLDAWQIHKADTVAVVFDKDADVGETVSIRMADGGQRTLVLSSPIPYGHKLALKPISVGDRIVKYGSVIGAATEPIAPGAHVHVHNMVSLRGRGDAMGTEG